MKITRSYDESQLSETVLKFYKKLMVSGLESVSNEKIQEIASKAFAYSLVNDLNKYTIRSRWMNAVNKAYNASFNGQITFGTYSVKSNMTILSLENDAEKLLFILFVTDPSLSLYHMGISKDTIAEAKEYAEKYLGFWDLKLFILQQKYLKIINERKQDEIITHLSTYSENNSAIKK